MVKTPCRYRVTDSMVRTPGRYRARLWYRKTHVISFGHALVLIKRRSCFVFLIVVIMWGARSPSLSSMAAKCLGRVAVPPLVGLKGLALLH